jgi:putative photosynthetic complex assembly protein
MSTTTRDPFPRAALIGAAGLVLLALAGAAAGRLVGPTSEPTEGAPLARRDLVFTDRADGAIEISQVAPTGQAEPLTVVTGQAGFLRGILRALARERRIDKLGHDVPFRLSAWPDGRLTLEDPADGRRIDLEAFGPDNAAVFARLLAARGNAS